MIPLGFLNLPLARQSFGNFNESQRVPTIMLYLLLLASSSSMLFLVSESWTVLKIKIQNFVASPCDIH